jgi:hypothetical protein
MAGTESEFGSVSDDIPFDGNRGIRASVAFLRGISESEAGKVEGDVLG